MNSFMQEIRKVDYRFGTSVLPIHILMKKIW